MTARTPRSPRTPDPARTHYHTLGVPRDAAPDDIRRAYRALAKQHHPDTGPAGSSAAFAAVAEAYEVLSDPAARRAYDESLASAAADESARDARPHYSWDNIAAPRGASARASTAEFDEIYDTFFVDRAPPKQ